MQVDYLGSRPKHVYYPVTTWRGSMNRLLRICERRTSHRIVLLHWLREERRSVPCGGKECEYHKLSYRTCVYAPAEEWHEVQRRWKRVIAVINESCQWILDMDLTNSNFDTKRVGGRYNSPVQFSLRILAEQPPPVEPFEIQETLERMWGAQKVHSSILFSVE